MSALRVLCNAPDVLTCIWSVAIGRLFYKGSFISKPILDRPPQSLPHTANEKLRQQFPLPDLPNVNCKRSSSGHVTLGQTKVHCSPVFSSIFYTFYLSPVLSTYVCCSFVLYLTGLFGWFLSWILFCIYLSYNVIYYCILWF